jgi:AcrR family transcriptional regulator
VKVDTVSSRGPKRATATVILDTAERLCAQYGIESVSIRDIAAAAAVSIAVIYHHYHSKGNLLLAILRTRFAEIADEYNELLTSLERQDAPAVRDIIRTVLQPINRWRRPERQAALQFYALALVSPLPELRETLDRGVVGLHRVVRLLQRALPRLSHEDICWRLHFTMKISHQTQLDAARLGILSEGRCDGHNQEEALARGIAFAEAAFLAPPFMWEKSATKGAATRKHRTPPKQRASKRRNPDRN